MCTFSDKEQRQPSFRVIFLSDRFFSVHHLVTNFTCVMFDAVQVAYTSVFRICFVLLYVSCCLEQLPSWNETTGHLFIEINDYSSFKCTICNSCH